MARYIENVFNAEVLSAKVTEEWLLVEARRVAESIEHYMMRMPSEVDSTDPYTGTSGVAYSFFYASPFIGREWLEKARKIMAGPMKSKSSHRHRNRRFLTGYIGTLAVMARDEQSNLSVIEEEIKVCGKDFEADDESVEHELFNGRAGYLAAITWLRKTVDSKLFSDASTKASIEHICQYLLYTGARTSDQSKEEFSPPLMYYWHDTMYIGAAHGLAGISLVLLNLVDDFDESEDQKVQKKYPEGLKSRIRDTVDWLVSIQTKEGGFASSLDYVSRPKSYDLVHWCHGPTGVIPALLMAYKVYGDKKYLEAAELGGEQIWKKGLLKKGPGLCHGISGSGYALLFLWRATNNPKWLNRAKSFAFLQQSLDVQKEQRQPDHVYSLFEGWAGQLCFLINLLPPNLENPRFPLFPYFP